MNTEQWQKLNELFAEALELNPNERTAFVAMVEDLEIKNELESLLNSTAFLDKNAVELSARTLAEDEPEKLASKSGNLKLSQKLDVAEWAQFIWRKEQARILRKKPL